MRGELAGLELVLLLSLAFLPQGATLVSLSDAPGSPFSVMALRPQAMATGDFNNDGKVDLAVVNSTSNDVTVLLNR
jgi:hypothetical protein